MQRRIERTIRRQTRLKRSFEAAGLKDDAAAAGAKLQILNRKYREFSKAAGLPEQRERLKAYTPRTINSIMQKSRDTYGTGFTMSANDGILSEKDIYAINQYKKSGVSYALNSILRGEAQMTDEYRTITHDIDQALLKLPTYQGTVYRSIRSKDITDLSAFWRKYVPKSFVIENQYTSSSTEIYDDTMDIQLIIESKRGCDMRGYNPLEQEVLFKRGTMFFVERAEGNKIWLTEV